MEAGLTKNRIVTELSRSPHGELKEYIPLGRQAAAEHGEFFAHLIAWNRIKGQVRDAKIALPLVALLAPDYHPEFVENSLAHMILLGPREQLKALRFALDNKIPCRSVVKRMLGTSLLQREKNWPKWERTMLQHRAVLRELFALLHARPNDWRTKACLYGYDKTDGKKVRLSYPPGGLFEVVARLKNMSPAEAAGTIMTRKIPFLVALGALAEKAKEPDLVLALIQSMTPTELVTNTTMLEKLGVKTNSALRGAFEEALTKASTSTANLFKTTRAAENIEDEDLKAKLRGLQEKQIEKKAGIEGNWLVLGDRSPSMEHSVEVAKEVAGVLAKMVKGKVYLVFFDGTPMTVDVTGLALDDIKKATRHIRAGGAWTSIGCGLQRMLDEKTEVDGIAVVSDGGENQAPFFADVYDRYCEKFNKELPVYFYQCSGDTDRFSGSMAAAHHDMQTFDLRSGKVDYYSLANLVETMRVSRYSLIDEIMATPLLVLPDDYKESKKRLRASA
jgi:hypothetical protein